MSADEGEGTVGSPTAPAVTGPPAGGDAASSRRRGDWPGLLASIGAAIALYGALGLLAVAPTDAGLRRDLVGGAILALATFGPVALGALVRSWWWPPVAAVPLIGLAIWSVVTARGPGAAIALLFFLLAAPIVAGEAGVGVVIGLAWRWRTGAGHTAAAEGNPDEGQVGRDPSGR